MAHSTEVLTRFQSGEVRLIFARHTETSELFLLIDGEAEVQRKFTAQHLRCPVPDCEKPRLMTVSRAHHRDGFRHFPGAGGHGPEGVFHMQASELIAVWLRGKYPGCRVQKEERSNAAGERRADVMITHPTGLRIAFEIQYAGLPPEKWQARHDSYQAQGIQDVWLFGHHGAQLTPARTEPGAILLNPTHERVVAAGLPLLWINAYTGQLGTAIIQESGVNGRTTDVPAEDGIGQLDLSDLDTFRLGGTGLTSDRLEELAANRTAIDVYRALLAQQAADLAARQAADAERRRLAKIEMAADYGRRRAEAAVIAEQLRPAWELSDEYQRTLQRFGGTWPSHLDVTVAWGAGIPQPNGQWQSALLHEFVDGRPVGYPVRAADCARHLAIPGYRLWDVETVVREWLAYLSRAGLLGGTQQISRTETRNAKFFVRLPARPGDRTTDLEPTETWSEKVARHKDERRETARLKTVAAVEDAQTKAERIAQEMKAAGIRSVAEQATNPGCVYCRQPLFDAYIEQGFHAVCAPGWSAGVIKLRP